MAAPICEQDGCNNESTHKCSDCGKVFCVRHIAYLDIRGVNVPTYGWKCKNCASEIVNRTSRATKIWGWAIPVCLVLAVLGMYTVSTGGGIGYLCVIPGILGAGFGIPFWGFYLFFHSQRKAFYRKNFSD
jgi:hypothetical protein